VVAGNSRTGCHAFGAKVFSVMPAHVIKAEDKCLRNYEVVL